MAIATPVLERKVENTQSVEQPSNAYRSSYMSSEELHNARIRDNYARLINPECKIEDLFNNAYNNQPVVQPRVEAVPQETAMVDVLPQATIQQAPVQQKPYLVENARADAAIFRADNPVNFVAAQPVAAQQEAKNDEEENEDLRPTETTIQYKSVNKANAQPSRKTDIKVNEEKEGAILSKRDKIIIGVFVAIVVSLFVLVVINSAIIANLNADLSTLNANLTTVKGTLAGVNSEINSLITPEAIDDFAQLHGLVVK
jgi:cell division protein FtsL